MAERDIAMTETGEGERGERKRKRKREREKKALAGIVFKVVDL